MITFTKVLFLYKVWNPDFEQRLEAFELVSANIRIIDLDPYLLQSLKAITAQHKDSNTL